MIISYYIDFKIEDKNITTIDVRSSKYRIIDLGLKNLLYI